MKEIVQLPADTPDSMLYSSKKVKDLGVYKAQWKTFLQRLNACHILKKSENVYMNSICNIQQEQKEKCINEFGLENSDCMFNNNMFKKAVYKKAIFQGLKSKVLFDIETTGQVFCIALGPVTICISIGTIELLYLFYNIG